MNVANVLFHLETRPLPYYFQVKCDHEVVNYGGGIGSFNGVIVFNISLCFEF